MLRRLFALLIVLALVGAGLYFWKLAPAGSRGLEGLGQRLDEARLTTAVKTALALNRRLAAADLSVSCEAGVVTLTGSVPSSEAQQLALQVAALVPDVVRVVDGTRVAPGPSQSGDDRTLGERLDDEALEAKLRLAMALNRSLEGAVVQVRVQRRKVTLSGTCQSPGQRQILLQVAQDVPDVSSVNDQLTACAEGC